jgi:hypothetical protein
MVRDDQRAAARRHVLDALLLDPEPVAVIEVEDGLDELEERFGAAPVVDAARQVLRGNELRARFARRRVGIRAGKLVDVCTRIEVGPADTGQNGSSTT